MKIDSLREHNRRFIDLMKEVEIEVIAEFNKRSGTLRLNSQFFDEIICKMRTTGLSAFQSLGEFACDILDFYEAKGKRLSVTIRTSAYPLLWEFLYTGQPTGVVVPELFWGLHHQVSRFLVGADFLPQAISLEGGVLFCRDRQLAHWLREMQMLQEFAGRLRFVLLDDWLNTYDSDFNDLQDRVFHACAAGNFSLVHIASHLNADPNPDGVINSYFSLSCNEQEVQINLEKINALRRDPRFRFYQNPLLFLNACQTMTDAVLSNRGESFPGSFLKLGAGAVIATACDIPDVFAVAFAQKFYELFLGDPPLPASEALRQARWYFMEQYNNPLGLAYGLYAHNDLIVEW